MKLLNILNQIFKIIRLCYLHNYMQKQLYESVGFIVASDIYEEAGIPHVKMYKIFN